MAPLDMNGPYELSHRKIDAVVTKTSPGNYALGRVSNPAFNILYVGRADNDINDRLKSWVGKRSRYTHFKFRYATSPRAAFEKECNNFHDFGEIIGLDNEKHPEPPDGTNWKCPICKLYDRGVDPLDNIISGKGQM